MKLHKLEKKTLRQEVYELLEEKIITAEILPGEKISLRSLSSELGVSIIPVREALFQLESEKAVVIESNKHIRVNNLTAAEIGEIFRVRSSLETMAVERACDFRPKSALPRIKRILVEMKASINKVHRYLKHNRSFHFEIYQLAESPILIDMIDGLWKRIGPYLYLHTIERDLAINMECHGLMYEALVDRDKNKMISALHKDLETAAEDIKQHINTIDYGFSSANML